MTRTCRYDVAVVGLGVAGAMSAWQAAGAGARVLAVERWEPGHRRSSSHGGSRVFRVVGTDGDAYHPLARLSVDLLRELAAGTREPLLVPCGGLFIGSPEVMRAVERGARAGGAPYERLDRDQLAARYPQHRLSEDDTALFDPSAGVVRPTATVRAAVAAAVALGAQVGLRTACREIRADDAGVTLVTDTGAVRARRVVVGAGAWCPDLLAGLGLPLRVERSASVWFRPRTATAAFRPGRFPVFVRASGDLHGWGIPDVDGSGVKVGASGDARRQLSRPAENWSIGIGPADVRPAEAFAGAAVAGLGARAATAEPCLTARTPDGHFVVGESDRLPGVVVCAGLGGHGFKYAPALGRAAAQLALDGATDVPVTAFHPDRFRPVPSTTGGSRHEHDQ